MDARAAKLTAENLLTALEPRWTHVQGVAAAASLIVSQSRLEPAVVEAAWLHDIGYAPELHRTGFHPLDAANFLAARDFSDEVVGLVAFHTGAEFEARERKLEPALKRFRRPSQSHLDALILADLCVSPCGLRVQPEHRIEEILSRYPASDPVHRAVTRSRAYLLACATRAALATGSPDEWGFAAA